MTGSTTGNGGGSFLWDVGCWMLEACGGEERGEVKEVELIKQGYKTSAVM